MKKIATSRDVAKLAGVSQSTVSRVLSGKRNVSLDARKRVTEAAESLGYYVNQAARLMRTNHTGSIGIVVPSLNNPFYAETAHLVYAHARQRGRVPLLQVTLNDPTATQGIVRDLIGRRIEGLLMASVGAYDPFMRAYCEKPVVPYVMYNRRLSGAEGNWVVMNNFHGANQATEYLISLGHHHILHIAGDMTYSTAIDRLNGYHAAMQIANLTPDVVNGNYDYDTAYEMMSRILDRGSQRRPTAVFCANDVMGVAVVDVLWAHQIHPGKDIAVIGYDNTSLSSFRSINLTTVSQQQDVMIPRALEGLWALIEGRTTIVQSLIEPKLIIRGTA